MKKDDYINEIRKINGFSRAVLTGIEVARRSGVATFSLVTDKTYTAAEEEEVRSITQKYLEDDFTAAIRVTKFVPDEEDIRRRILSSLKRRSPACEAFIRPEDVVVEKSEGSARFLLDVSAEEKKFLPTDSLIDGVCYDLAHALCGSFYGSFREKEKEIVEEVAPVPEEKEVEEVFPPRFFDVENYATIDGGEKQLTARYIEDCAHEGEYVVCGKIVGMQEKQTSKGKPMFRFRITDGTGTLNITYFSKQSTIEKVRALKVGDGILCYGANEAFNGNLSYHAKNVNRGTVPENFVPTPRPARETPKAYHTVFPEPIEDFTQTDLFYKREVSDDIKNNVFVVFDLETTGLNNTGTGGEMDSIIEIGAVKVIGGEVKEKFSSFVAYSRKLPPNIVELTGITDDMLVGAPTIDKVMPDFVKFCDGCRLVGHNVTFDYRFVQYYAEKQRYSFSQKRYDTMTLGQELLILPNYKLNTLADFYQIKFNHHRAYDDALTTAKVFLQLMEKRKVLPEA